MLIAISLVSVLLLGMVGTLAFAPVAEFRRRALKAVLVSAALVAGLGMGVSFALFLGLTMAGKDSMVPVAMQALMTAIAVPFVLGLATVAFGAMAFIWQNVFDRTNDRFAANIYVLIGVAIVVVCASPSLRADWPGYVLAAMAVPLIPTLAARRMRRARPAGFGLETAEAAPADRPLGRWAQPVIAARRPRKPAKAVKPAQPAPAARIVQPAKPVQASAPATRTVRRAPPAARPAAPVSTGGKGAAPGKPAASRPPASDALLAGLAPVPMAPPEKLRRGTPSQRPAQQPPQRPAQVAGRTAPPAVRQQPRPVRQVAAEPARSVPRGMSATETHADHPVERAREAVVREERTSAPAGSRPDRNLPRPTLLPPGTEVQARPASRRAEAAEIVRTDDRRRPLPSYPLTAPFEPGTDRWGTFVEGVLTDEDGVQRRIAARSTQAFGDEAFKDLSGAA